MKRMRAAAIGAGLIVLMAAAAPESAAAQESGWWEWALGERVRSRGSVTLPRRPDVRNPRLPRGEDARRDGRAEARSTDRGPKFCQSGAGHPVHGREWCREKGFGLGSSRDVFWQDRGWDDVILRAPRGTQRRTGVLDRGGLIDVLGDVVFGRLEGERSRLGARSPLTGRWVSPAGGARVLQVRSGSMAVAELTDLDGDGRVDAVLVPRR